MAEKIDLKMTRREDGIYDIGIGDDGDLEATGGVETSLLMSFFAERRASEAEVAVPFLRRGWWGNAFTDPDGFEIGSKLWLLHQAKNRPETLRQAEDFTRQAFQWLISEQIFKRLDVTGTAQDDTIIINVILTNQGNNIDTLHFDLLNQTIIELANAS